MKVKRYKHAKKVLSFYKNTFKLHEPYQIIGNVCVWLCMLRYGRAYIPISTRCSGRYVLPCCAEGKDTDQGTATEVLRRVCSARYASPSKCSCVNKSNYFYLYFHN